MNIKQLAKQYNIAKSYKEGVKTLFFCNLKEKLENDIEIISKMVIYPGLDNEHDKLIEARTIKKILLYIQNQADKTDKLKNELKKQHINVD